MQNITMLLLSLRVPERPKGRISYDKWYGKNKRGTNQSFMSMMIIKSPLIATNVVIQSLSIWLNLTK